MNILIAEDNLSIRTLLEEWTKEWGYTPICVPDGEKAWQIINSEYPPKLAILDWVMPKLDGLDLCQRIKQQPNLPFIYVMLLTGKSSQQDLITGFDAGADDFLSKPVQPEELRSRLAVGRRILDYQEALTNRHEQLHTLFMAMPGVMILKDERGRWLQANEASVRLFQLQGVDYIGKSDQELASLSRSRANLLRTLQIKDEQAWKRADILHQELQFVNEQGKSVYYELIRVPLFYHDGRRKNMILLGHDITERKGVEQRLSQEAKYDALTKLLNRRYFEERLESALTYAQRFKHPLSVCVCDIDKFKNVNDTHGHQVGDTVLKQFSQIIRSEVRSVDAAGRLGGDEFCVLLSGCNAKDSLHCLTRIRRRLESTVFRNGNGQFFWVSGSFGIAEWSPTFNTKDALLEAADQALYRAKRNGRNQVMIYTDSG
jgi:two-component system cell cycle response regulator